MNRRRISVFLYIASYIVVLGLRLHLRWPLVLVLLVSVAGGCRSGNSVDVVGESGAPFFGEVNSENKGTT